MVTVEHALAHEARAWADGDLDAVPRFCDRMAELRARFNDPAGESPGYVATVYAALDRAGLTPQEASWLAVAKSAEDGRRYRLERIRAAEEVAQARLDVDALARELTELVAVVAALRDREAATAARRQERRSATRVAAAALVVFPIVWSWGVNAAGAAVVGLFVG